MGGRKLNAPPYHASPVDWYKYLKTPLNKDKGVSDTFGENMSRKKSWPPLLSAQKITTTPDRGKKKLGPLTRGIATWPPKNLRRSPPPSPRRKLWDFPYFTEVLEFYVREQRSLSSLCLNFNLYLPFRTLTIWKGES